jgi:hypothetical protein
MDIARYLTVEMLLAVGLGAIAVYLLLDLTLKRKRRRPYLPFAPPTDAAAQLRHVMAAEFSRKPVMSKAEYNVFRIVEKEVAAIRGGHRTFAQTSLGEILRSDNPLAHSSINSKRADILVVGPDGLPFFVVEYQGQGHYQGTAAARDAVEKEALRKAGVGYVEVMHTHSVPEIQDRIRSMLRSVSPQPVSSA